MPLMGSMQLGVSGLQTSQNAVNTTSNNLANLSTTGYTRQQVVMSDLQYDNIGTTGVNTTQVGLGVNIQEVRRVRDYFLDKSYREENGREGFYEGQASAINEIEDAFGELEGTTFQDEIEKLWTSINELAKEPESIVYRASLVQSSVSFLERADAIYNQLVNYQESLNDKIISTTSRINELGATIDNLNKVIAKCEANGVENANDYRDQRDTALDELSKLINISYDENENNIVTVRAEGVEFVTDHTYHAINLTVIEGTNLLKPQWSHLEDRDVFLYESTISTAKGNDTGYLKGIILSRGDGVPTYEDVPGEEPQIEDYYDENKVLDEEKYNADMNEYKEKVAYYNEHIAMSSIMTSMATLDKFVNGIVTQINDVLCPNTTASELTDMWSAIEASGIATADEVGDYYELTVKDEEGNEKTIKVRADTTVLDMSIADHGNDANDTYGTELFSRNYTERYSKYTFTADDGSEHDIYIYNANNAFGASDNYRLGNLEVNYDTMQDYTFIPMTTSTGEADYDLGERLVALWNQEFARVSPGNSTVQNYKDFYTDYTDLISNLGSQYNSILASQETLIAQIDDGRQNVAGVSSDEELTNIIKYQNGYNAASRYINVIDEMLEHIINTLGQ